MELKPGTRIILKSDYIKKFTKEEKDSRSFQIVALTDVAVGVRNIRSQRMYTLPLDAISRNVDTTAMANLNRPLQFTSHQEPPKPTVIILNPTPPPPEPTPSPTPTPPPVPIVTFTHVAPIPVGGISMVPISATASVITADNPFASLYGNG